MVVLIFLVIVCFLICINAAAIYREKKQMLNMDILHDFSCFDKLLAQQYSNFDIYVELITRYLGHMPKVTKIKIGKYFKKNIKAGSFSYHENHYRNIVVSAYDRNKQKRIVYVYEPTDDNFFEAQKFAAFLEQRRR